MKKTLATITTIALVLIATTAMAKGAKVPKLLCIGWDSWAGWPQQLSLKAIGNVYIQGEKVKTYAINGVDSLGPLTGTAYVEPGTSLLRASYSTTYTSGSWTYPVDAGYNLVFDLSTGTGIVDYRYANPPENELNDGYDEPVSIADCAAASMLMSGTASTNAGPASK